MRPSLVHDLVHRLSAALGSVQLYTPSHPLVRRHVLSLADIVDRLHRDQQVITMGILGDRIIVDEVELSAASPGIGELLRRCRTRSVERLVIERGVEPQELIHLLEALARPHEAERMTSLDSLAQAAGTWLALPHIRVGRLGAGHEGPTAPASGGTAAIRRMYAEGVAVAMQVWRGAESEQVPDPKISRAMIDGLARAVAENRTALLALVALKHYENYTFTHMVNVAILTMAQARTLGIDGALLREFGMAALMHDIGKIRIPHEILTKADALTDEEFAIMKRHPVDGAEMLRRTREIPALAPIVAFEHHLRLDGTGYPAGVVRGALNLGTMLCSIADVYDAMRSRRRYQQAFPTDRILAVYERNDGSQFDQHLVRRFVHLLGIYPPGTLVRLSTGEIAVVVLPGGRDPFRPTVRIVFDADGTRSAEERSLDLSATDPDEGSRDIRVVAPVDPADYPVDPLAYV